MELTQLDETPSTLRYLWEQLGDFKRAIGHQLFILNAATTTWDRVSAAHGLAELHLTDGDPSMAWMLIESHAERLHQIDGWQQVGLGRMLVKAAFEVARAAPKSTAQAAFRWACQHESQLETSTWEILTIATEAAEAVGDRERQHQFRKAADEERARIDEMIGK